ncbi:MAG TPA: Rv2993c-like domain-containing protein, partial [Solirubrobacterales bacterium]|nr:Rv2993c-like domain-containing protein [Solirubrobacterales bacterium]
MAAARGEALAGMRLCRFQPEDGGPALGLVEGEEVVELAASGAPAEPARALDELGQERLAELAAGSPRRALADVGLLAP